MMNRMMLRKAGGVPVVNDFIMTINTTLGDGLNQIRLPIQGTDPMDIDWGDGTTETVTQTAAPSSTNWVTHSYASAGVYDVKIQNTIQRIFFNNQGDKNKLTDIKQWGTAEYNEFVNAFHGCQNISIFSAIDAPIFSVNIFPRLTNAFDGCINFNTNINHWDVSRFQLFNRCFTNCQKFNQPLNNWDMTNANQVSAMFEKAFLFDQNLSNWNIINLTNGLNFLLNAQGLSTPNYDATLIGWEATLQAAYPNGVGYPNTGLNIHFGSSKYTIGSVAETARTSLTNNFGWVITDGGGI